MMAPVDAGALREGPHTIKYAAAERPRKRTRTPSISGRDSKESPPVLDATSFGR